ncbi:10762_t:CDS:2, partial [Scutellospora calospora]
MNKIISATALLNDELERKFYEMFKIPILQNYGLTETSAIRNQPNTTKNAVPAKILSENGQLWVHGPNISKGYLNNKEATDAIFDKDGFINTGDIVSIDEQ